MYKPVFVCKTHHLDLGDSLKPLREVSLAK